MAPTSDIPNDIIDIIVNKALTLCTPKNEYSITDIQQIKNIASTSKQFNIIFRNRFKTIYASIHLFELTKEIYLLLRDASCKDPRTSLSYLDRVIETINRTLFLLDFIQKNSISITFKSIVFSERELRFASSYTNGECIGLDRYILKYFPEYILQENHDLYDALANGYQIRMNQIEDLINVLAQRLDKYDKSPTPNIDYDTNHEFYYSGLLASNFVNSMIAQYGNLANVSITLEHKVIRNVTIAKCSFRLRNGKSYYVKTLGRHLMRTPMNIITITSYNKDKTIDFEESIEKKIKLKQYFRLRPPQSAKEIITILT